MSGGDRILVSELATAKNISRPAISQAVEILVKKGLLTRVPSREDRRCVDLVLTEAGNHLLDTVFKETRGLDEGTDGRPEPGGIGNHCAGDGDHEKNGGLTGAESLYTLRTGLIREAIHSISTGA